MGVLMQQVETMAVRLEALHDVELRRGLVLPAGFYDGTETYTRLAPIGSGRDRTPSRFEIKLTAEKLANMGAEIPPNRILTIDVTTFVRLGVLKPA
jgi:hypothetical protein